MRTIYELLSTGMGIAGTAELILNGDVSKATLFYVLAVWWCLLADKRKRDE